MKSLALVSIPVLAFSSGFIGGQSSYSLVIDSASKIIKEVHEERNKISAENQALHKAIADLKWSLTCTERSNKAASDALEGVRQQRNAARKDILDRDAILSTRKLQIAALRKVVDNLAGPGVSSLALDKPETFLNYDGGTVNSNGNEKIN